MATSENRRFFRFPAISDHEPVKVSEEERELFKEEQSQLEPTAPISETLLSATMPETTKKTNTTNEETTLTNEKAVVPKPYRKQAANVKRSIAEGSILGQRHDQLKQSKNRYQEESSRAPISKVTSGGRDQVSPKISSASTQNFYQDRKYFKPKYIPTSTSPKGEAKASSLALARAGAALKERKTSYLLLDHDEHFAPFHVKERESDPTIRKYRTNEQDIPVTRKQYKRLKTEAGLLPEDRLAERLPQTRKEIQHAKKAAKESAAFLKKQEQETPKKKNRPNSRLEKTLSGIMEDEENKQGYNRYFEDTQDES